MDQNPDPSTFTKLTGNIQSTVLTYDPLLMGSVQPVPPPPPVKPLPPTAPPPANATVYDPMKDVSKFTDDYSSAHNQQAYDDKETDTIDHLNPPIDYDESVWDNNHYKMYEYNKFDPMTGQYSIDPNLEPPTKKRKLNQSLDTTDTIPEFNDTKPDDSHRYSLQSLGLQPLAARAIIEKLDCMPKLRYSEEFHRDVTNAMQYEADMITQKLSNNKDSIQNIYPTSNGRNRKHIYTSCGVDPNDKLSTHKLRAHLLSKSISTMIYTKQKQALDTIICTKQKQQKETNMMHNAQQKSLEIARKLGFVPQFLKADNISNNVNSDAEYDHEDGEIKETDASKKLKQLQIMKKDIKSETPIHAPTNFNAIEQAKRLLNPVMRPPLERQSAFTQFECKSVLKSDGSEYDKYLGSEMRGVKKYDSNFRPMFPITNKNYTFSVVSNYGLKLLSKYGFKRGDGLGKHKQGVTTFPRLSGQNSLKGICYAERNRKNLTMGFMHCVACDKAFCGYTNLQHHIISKKHKKNLALKPNNLVLLCVQCQLQFPTCQKIKEHFMLVKHDDSIPGIAAFQKLLKDERRHKQIEYIQNLQTKPNPYKMEKEESVEKAGNDEDKAKEEPEDPEEEPLIIMPPPSAPLPIANPAVPSTPYTAPAMAPPLQQQYSMFMNQAMAAYQQQLQMHAQPHAYMQYNHAHAMARPAMPAAYNPRPTPIEIAIDSTICNEIKHKIYELGLQLPMAVPTVPWIYCPSCKSFFTTFSKFNAHHATQRHLLSMTAWNEKEKNKMNALFQYIKQKEEQHLITLQPRCV
eukprot:472581_1